MKRFVLFLLLVVGLITVQAQDVRVNSTTDTTHYLIGDYIHYTIEIVYPNSYEIINPVVHKDSLKEIALISSSKREDKENNGFITSRFKFILSYYDSGSVAIPSFPVSVKKKSEQTFTTEYTPSLIVTVSSLIVAEDSDPRDITAIKELPFDWVFWLIVTLILIAVIVLIWFLYKKFKKKPAKAEEKPKVVVPYYVQAMLAIEALEQAKPWREGKIKEFHSDITEIIRNYFEKHYGIMALEQTSSEIIESLTAKTKEKEVLSVTDRFLSNADMVKFAKYIPMESVNEEMIGQAKLIVTLTSDKVKKQQEPANATLS